MRVYARLLLFAFAVWLIPFVVSIVIFPLRESGSPLFETVMPVTLALVGLAFALLHFNRLRTNFLRQGIMLGVLFFAVSVLIDLPLMLPPPIQMSFGQYVADVGLTYLIYPIITIGLGYALERAHRAPRTA